MAKRAKRKLLSEEDWEKLSVSKWFEDALEGEDVPKPSLEICQKFAQDFQNILNNHDNYQLEIASNGKMPIRLLKNISLTELECKKLKKFMKVANQLLVEAEEIENFFGGYIWRNGKGDISLHDIQELLGGIGAVPLTRRLLQIRPIVHLSHGTR